MTKLALLALALVACAPAPASGRAVSGHAEPRCVVRGGLPDPVCTPGAVDTTDVAIVCGQSTRERRSVPESERRSVFVAYGIAYPPARGAYELDHLVPLELGGSNAIANLWPEPAATFHDKDQSENALHRRVCAEELGLDMAQREMAADWRIAR